LEKAIPTNYFAIVIFVCFTTKCHKERTLRTLLQKEAVKILNSTSQSREIIIEILETDWKNKNLYMHKGLQFVKLIEEKFKQYNNEERKK